MAQLHHQKTLVSLQALPAERFAEVVNQLLKSA